ncbi:hypothetical protein AAHE18_16G161700 [Arachis hypogaea]
MVLSLSSVLIRDSLFFPPLDLALMATTPQMTTVRNGRDPDGEVATTDVNGSSSFSGSCNGRSGVSGGRDGVELHDLALCEGDGGTERGDDDTADGGGDPTKLAATDFFHACEHHGSDEEDGPDNSDGAMTGRWRRWQLPSLPVQPSLKSHSLLLMYVCVTLRRLKRMGDVGGVGHVCGWGEREKDDGGELGLECVSVRFRLK